MANIDKIAALTALVSQANALLAELTSQPAKRRPGRPRKGEGKAPTQSAASIDRMPLKVTMARIADSPNYARFRATKGDVLGYLYVPKARVNGAEAVNLTVTKGGKGVKLDRIADSAQFGRFEHKSKAMYCRVYAPLASVAGCDSLTVSVAQ